MVPSNPCSLQIDLGHPGKVTAVIDAPARLDARTPALLLAHGANNDLAHPLLAEVATHLAASNTALTLRFNFPYAERRANSLDSLPVLLDAFRRAHDYLVDEVAAPGAPIFLGGKSLGGRVAAELVSRHHEGEGLVARGLIILGYPLHAPGRKDQPHVEPLRRIDVPSLFCIGTHDPFCDLELLRPVVARLPYPGEISVVEGGDHSLRIARGQTASNGKKLDPEDGYRLTALAVTEFIRKVVRAG
ncbi:MAG: hypothetical protein H5T84_05460, partial [Thermoleophilia bacterium]|nr:hypothetical protein [Thermoleophilia bacterium]